MQRSIWIPFLLFALGARPARAEQAASDLSEAWTRSLDEEVVKLAKSFRGRIACYMLDSELGAGAGHDFEKPSYLASGIKLTFLVEVFRQAHEGRLSLDEQLTYGEEDVRDGAPRLNPRPFGTRFTIKDLLEFMVRASDNSASDMLARRVGLHNIETGMKELGFDGFTPITRLIDVRRGILREVDPHADDMTPTEIRTVRWVVGWQAQAVKLAEVLGRPAGSVKKEELQAAFHRYYETDTNAARLDTVAKILDRMSRRELISPEASEAMLKLLSEVETSHNRIPGKLPPGVRVAHKTGSQWERICDLGVITLPDKHPLVFTACLAGGDDRNLAEGTLAQLARHAYDLAVAAHRLHGTQATKTK